MAIKEIKREWSPCQLDYVKTFLLHSEKDVKDLPKCCVGSKATVSETDNEYYCTADGWKLGSELGGGGSSEVVILPETEAAETDDGFMIMTPLSATPTVGATAEINYNGAKYTSPIIYDEQNAMFAMGNTETMGIQGGNTDAPFFAALIPEGLEGAYGMVKPLDDATSVTLSIVQVGAASGGGSESAGGGVFRVVCENGTPTGDIGNGAMMGLIYTPDKTGPDILSAFNSGEHVFIDFINPLSDGGTIRTPVVFAKDGAIEAGALSNGVSVVGRITWDDAGTTIRFEVYPPA